MSKAKRNASTARPAAPAATTPEAPASAPEMPSLTDLGRHVRVISERYDLLDTQSLAFRDGTPEATALDATMRLLDRERMAAEDLILARPALTLGDAAAQAACGFGLADATLELDLPDLVRRDRLEDRLKQMRLAFASILLVVAKAADLDLDTINWPDLRLSVARHIPAAEA